MVTTSGAAVSTALSSISPRAPGCSGIRAQRGNEVRLVHRGGRGYARATLAIASSRPLTKPIRAFRKSVSDVDIFADDRADRHVMACDQFIGPGAQDRLQRLVETVERPALGQLALDHHVDLAHRACTPFTMSVEEIDIGIGIFDILDGRADAVIVEFVEQRRQRSLFHVMLIKRLNGGKARGGARLGTGVVDESLAGLYRLSPIRHVFWERGGGTWSRPRDDRNHNSRENTPPARFPRSQRQMASHAVEIVDLGIGGEPEQPQRPAPIRHRRDERGRDAPSAMARIDEQSFQKQHRRVSQH